MVKKKRTTIITRRHGDPPLSCQHHRIDNDTCRCLECDEHMIMQRYEAETVLSAPNLAACTNKACAAALGDGTYDENDPPPGCTNPGGAYIPGVPHEVVIGYTYSYECERCRNNGTLITEKGVVYDCGHSHKGAPVLVNEEC
jgi:hypothetical protein